MVAVNVWFHWVRKTRPAAAPVRAPLRHMMFPGLEARRQRLFQGRSSRRAGNVTLHQQRRTNYWRTSLELPRDGALPGVGPDGLSHPGHDPDKLDNQRDVVKTNAGRVGERALWEGRGELPSRLYPPGHPYSWPVIRRMADLSAASLDDVSAFFSATTRPITRPLCIAGDFKPDEARRLVEKYFAGFRRPPWTAHLVAPPLDGVRRAQAEDTVNLARSTTSGPRRLNTSRATRESTPATCSPAARPRGSTARSSTRKRSRRT